MNFVAALVRRIVGDAQRAVEDTRRQAPGARMVGEFTVRQIVKEARRRAGLSRQDSSRPDSGTRTGSASSTTDEVSNRSTEDTASDNE